MSEFYGCNEQLIEMINIWADIQKKNKPCWINIVEETGVGKTRLVQEFYKCLSDVEYMKNKLKLEANYNPEGYWPETLPLDSDQLGINPDFNQINPVGEMPWLWFGMRATDPGLRNKSQNNCAVYDAVKVLYPHLIQKDKDDKNILLLIKLSMKVFGLIPVVGSILSIGEVTNDIMVRLNEPSELSQDIFKTVLSFLNINKPVIIILDDAHWLDLESLKFIKLLINEEFICNRKLMIISTSWKKEWNELAKSQNVDSVVTIYKSLDVFKVFKKIDLELSKFDNNDGIKYLLSQFIGLKEDDLKLLIKRSNGNWRYLTEIVKALKSDSSMFVDDNVNNHFNCDAAKIIESNKYEIDLLIENRFNSLNILTKKAIAYGSFQGAQFSPEITSSVYREVNTSEDNVISSIEAGENPGAYIAKVNNDLKEFLPGPYYAIAKRWLEKRSDEFEKIKKAYIKHTINIVLSSIDNLSEAERSSIVEIISTSIDSKLKMQYLVRLIHDNVSKGFYREGCKLLNQLSDLHEKVKYKSIFLIEVASEIPSDPDLNTQYVLPEYAASIFQLLGYFGPGNLFHDALKSADIFDENTFSAQLETGLKFAAYSVENKQKQIAWQSILVNYLLSFGRYEEALKMRYILIDWLVEYININTDCSEEYKYQLIVSCINYSIEFCNYKPQILKYEEQSDHLSNKYSLALSTIKSLKNTDSQEILFIWGQIRALIFGQQLKEHQPEAHLVGDIYSIYTKTADKLFEMIYSFNENEKLLSLGDELLFSLVDSVASIYRFAELMKYEISINLLVNVKPFSDEVYRRVKTGRRLSNELIIANLSYFIERIKFKHRMFDMKVTDNQNAIRDYQKSDFKITNLIDRNIEDTEVDKDIDLCRELITNYLENGFQSVPLSLKFAELVDCYLQIYDIRNRHIFDSNIKADFNLILQLAIDCRDPEKLWYYGSDEGSKFIVILVTIYDGYINGSRMSKECWIKLREGYKILPDKQFYEVIENIRAGIIS